MNDAEHLNFDDAWDENALPMRSRDLRRWGPYLRFSAPTKLIEEFYREMRGALPPFVLYGSGDFHHLTALWLRGRVRRTVVVSFDNHPDWDIRPPKWGCGGWINRALELPSVVKVSVWGCGNFECWWPRQIFGNRRAERAGRLEVHPWAEERGTRRGAILRSNWRERFTAFARELEVEDVYVTIDLDCLRAQDAVTNWESGRFALGDVEWALRELRRHARIARGDICGAYSTPVYARAKQRFAAGIDHPKLERPAPEKTRAINERALGVLWPALTQ